MQCKYRRFSNSYFLKPSTVSFWLWISFDTDSNNVVITTDFQLKSKTFKPQLAMQYSLIKSYSRMTSDFLLTAGETVSNAILSTNIILTVIRKLDPSKAHRQDKISTDMLSPITCLQNGVSINMGNGQILFL